MNTERSRAYSNVTRIVSDLAAAKLHAPEQEAIREAADALLFSTDIAHDDEARAALARLEAVVERLVANDRIEPETGRTILDAVEACGPHPVAV